MKESGLVAAVVIVIDKNRIIHINLKINTFLILQFNKNSRKERVTGYNRKNLALELLLFFVLDKWHDH